MHILKADLYNALQFCNQARSHNDCRTYMDTIRFNFLPGSIELQATNGHIGAVAIVQNSSELNAWYGWKDINFASIDAVIKLLKPRNKKDGESLIKIDAAQHYFVIAEGNKTIYAIEAWHSTETAGNPQHDLDLNRVIPAQDMQCREIKSFAVDFKYMAKAMDACKYVTNKNNHYIELAFYSTNHAVIIKPEIYQDSMIRRAWFLIMPMRRKNSLNNT